MSYILDALKRADAERTRGTVPGLHAQPAATPPPARSGPRTGLWLGIATALVLGGIAAGVGLRYAPTAGGPAKAAMSTVAVQSVPPQAPAPQAEPTPAAARPAGVSAPTPPQTVNPMPAPAQAPPAPPSRPAEVTAAAAPASMVQPASTQAIATAPTRALTPPAHTTQPVGSLSSSGEAPLRSALPEELQRQIPALNITGAVASENPAQRLLLVNGQVLPQGGSPAPGVTVVEIRAQSSVFSFRDTRFRLVH